MKNCKKALITIVYGNEYRKNFNNYALPNWRRYCERHSLELIIFDKLFDNSERAKSRSVAWQKCLSIVSADVKDFSQVCWMDSDIIINPESPNVFEGIAENQIGAVDAYSTPTIEDHEIGLKRLYDEWTKNKVEFLNNLTPSSYHESFGLSAKKFDHVVQTGVIVASPNYHKDIFNNAYNNHEDKGEAFWNYEMRPLSYEILSSADVKWLSPKFNSIWIQTREYVYPFIKPNFNQSFEDRFDLIFNLFSKNRRLARRKKAYEFLMVNALKTQLNNNYFLHFAGAAGDMRLFSKF